MSITKMLKLWFKVYPSLVVSVTRKWYH